MMKFDVLYHFLIIFTPQEVNLLPLDEWYLKYIHSENMIRIVASECVLSIAKAYFPDNSVVITNLASADASTSKSQASSDSINLSDLFNEIKWSVFISKATQAHASKKSPHGIDVIQTPVDDAPQSDKGGKRKVPEQVLFFRKADNYVLQVKNIMEFERNLKQLMSFFSWNPHAKFLIFLNVIVKDIKPFLSYFIQKLWKKQIIDAVIMLNDPQDESRFLCYTWFPYIMGHCGDQFNDPSLVGVCTKGVVEVTGDTLFPPKIPNDLNGCPMKTYAYVLQPYVFLPKNISINQTNAELKEGVEVLLMEVLAAKLNFKPIYQISKTNNTLSNLIDQLVKSQTDIAIGAIAPENERHKLVDFTHTYLDESITWVVPASNETPRWKNFLFSFTLEAWLVILFAYILSSIATWWISRNNPLEPAVYKNFTLVLLWLYSVLINIPLPGSPMSGALRYVIFSWILFSFIANVTFQSFLMSALTKPTYETQLSSFDELLHSHLKYGIIDSHKRFYKNDLKYKDIVDTARICDDIHECLFNVSSHKDLAVALPRSNFKSLSNHFMDRYGRPLIYAFESDIITYPIEMLMTKGFPILEKINMYILFIKEVGLIEKWRNDYVRSSSGEVDTVVEDSEEVETPLGLAQMQVAFLVLGIGLLVSTIVFVLEKMMKRNVVDDRFRKGIR